MPERSGRFLEPGVFIDKHGVDDESDDAMVNALVCSLVIAGSGSDRSQQEPLVPWFVPRSASVGTFFNREMFSPNIRLAWEWPIVNQPRNALIVTAAFGTGFGANPPRPMTAHFQHVGLVGVAFRGDYKLFHWGFSAMFGGAWYRAAYTHTSSLFFENYVLPYGDGRVQAGVFVADHVRLALYLGYAAPFIYARNRPGNNWVGGFNFGVVVDWR